LISDACWPEPADTDEQGYSTRTFGLIKDQLCGDPRALRHWTADDKTLAVAAFCSVVDATHALEAALQREGQSAIEASTR
jgi:hypothetical protein